MRAAVLGRPIAHSLSPALHRAAYAELGLDWTYEAVDCGEDEFVPWFRDLGDDWAGLSLTMPLKQVAREVVDVLSTTAEVTGAVNTVSWGRGGYEPRVFGDNTDVQGIRTALESAVAGSPLHGVQTACVIGAGATARSAVAALELLGVRRLSVLSRSRDRAADAVELAARRELACGWAPLSRLDLLSGADLVVSTLPAGVADLIAADLRSSAGRVHGVLLDVSYHPWPSVVAATWRELGGIAVGGFEMLLHQAAAQVRIMTGRPAPLAAMRAAGLAALQERGQVLETG